VVFSPPFCSLACAPLCKCGSILFLVRVLILFTPQIVRGPKSYSVGPDGYFLRSGQPRQTASFWRLSPLFFLQPISSDCGYKPPVLFVCVPTRPCATLSSRPAILFSFLLSVFGGLFSTPWLEEFGAVSFPHKPPTVFFFTVCCCGDSFEKDRTTILKQRPRRAPLYRKRFELKFF